MAIPPHTVLKFVHDSLTVHHTVVVHDTLTQFLGTIREPLLIKLDDAITFKDVISWVAPGVIAAASGLVGVLVGASRERRAAQEQRMQTMDKMLKRVASNLRRMQRLVDQDRIHSFDTPLPTWVAEELEVVWNIYYRVAESIFTLGDNDLSERLDAYFKRAHIVAESLKNLEKRSQEFEASLDPWNPRDDTPSKRSELQLQRKAEIQNIVAMGAEAGDLLARIDRIKVEELVP
jgi:hypothetical protein